MKLAVRIRKTIVLDNSSLFAAYHKTTLGTECESENGATVTIKATDGAKIHMTDATMGANDKNNTVSVSIDETSSYTGSSLNINKGTTFTNDGSIELSQGSS